MEEKEFEKIDKLLQWVVLKNQIRHFGTKNDFFIFGNFIYWAHLGINIGSEQEEDRPVLVVRTTKESSVCNIIPITLERLEDKIPYHIDLSNGIGTALVEQLRVISKDRIYSKKFVNHKHATINEDDYKLINEQLRYLYFLKPLFK